MIQRIQSFLLVLALVGFVLLFLFPTATFEAGNVTTSSLTLVQNEEQRDFNMETGEPGFIPQNSVILMIMAIVLVIGTLVGIFLYKNRVRQMRFVSMLGLINLVYIGIMFLSCIPDAADVLANMNMGEVSTTYSVGTFVPIVTLILIVIAQRCIRSDEMKVRAADRIR